MSAMVPLVATTRGILMAWVFVNWSIMISVLVVFLKETEVDILGHLALRGMFHLQQTATMMTRKQVLRQQLLIVMTLKIPMQVSLNTPQKTDSHLFHHLAGQEPDQIRRIVILLQARLLVLARQSKYL